MKYCFLSVVCLCWLCTSPIFGQQLVHYSGTTLSNPLRHDGGLDPVMGVHNIQIFRANRQHPSNLEAKENKTGWTYNHQPMMAYWKGKFYVHYLSDEKDEQVPPSHTVLQMSDDGYNWTSQRILFPEYHVPDGFKKEGVDGEAHNLIAVMHQRQGFYISHDNHLFALGTYGVCMNKKDHNNDGNGIGRVIREIRQDGSFGPIYFIYYNHGFCPENTDFPHWMKGNKFLRRACEEIYNNPRMLMGWVEEANRGDSILPVHEEYKAYNDYTLPNGDIVALWKFALTSISKDKGRTWLRPINRAEGFVTSNAKIWGQCLTDHQYATVYNPSEFRWPLALSLSSDGLDYRTLSLVCGEVPPMRYGGNYKSCGPQYVRGILEGNGIPKDSDLWVTYSMNKEDMWVSDIPVPVILDAHAHADDDFAAYKSLEALKTWNLYSPIEAPIALDGEWLTLSDEDKYDYACAERKIPVTKNLTVQFDLQANQNKNGILQISFLDNQGTACSRLELTDDGVITCKGGARYAKVINYVPHQTYHLEVQLNATTRRIVVYVDGKKYCERMFFAPIAQISRVMFRTGIQRTTPTIDTPADWDGMLDVTGEKDTLAVYRIAHFKTTNADEDAGSAFLHSTDYKHYVDEFNAMEPENMAQAIPNSESWKWMQENIPLFDCPQQNIKQMYYYRWWTLRKHIEKTSVGYAMTEFLVRRTYADKFNLIASAVGHHIHEARWLRNPIYLDQIINTWYHGNNGEAMKKINFYSSWMPSSVWDRYLVDNCKDWVTQLLPSLVQEYTYWDMTHRWQEKNGSTLYWQYDVRDAMEETISGGRKEKNARPSINSYMYGNANAIYRIAQLAGNQQLMETYKMKADTLKSLVENRLWNKQHQFFEVYKPVNTDTLVTSDSAAQVREEIGFLPWYFNLPADNGQFDKAWLQAGDAQGFSAPYGLTTAEQRHPQFRTHGVGKCEWDGAIWPFATSQTLTAMANYLNDYQHPVITDSLYFSQLEKYVQSQYHRGLPYIGEYLDEQNGAWLKGDQERSRYYNHSTFCDLIITGLVGLRPRADNVIEINPLLPQGKWAWFCLDKVRYHGHDLTILWDETGSKYHAGQGLQLYVDGKLVAHRKGLGRLWADLGIFNQ